MGPYKSYCVVLGMCFANFLEIITTMNCNVAEMWTFKDLLSSLELSFDRYLIRKIGCFCYSEMKWKIFKHLTTFDFRTPGSDALRDILRHIQFFNDEHLLKP